MGGIGRLQNKITADLVKKEAKTPSPTAKSPLSDIKKENIPPRKIPLKNIPRIDINLSPQAVPSTPLRPKISPKKEGGKNPKDAAKDKLYQQILADSLKERLERQKFIDQVEGKTTGKAATNISTPVPSHKVVFQPVPQTPSQLQKILVRILIVLLVASFGLLAYLILKGYLI